LIVHEASFVFLAYCLPNTMSTKRTAAEAEDDEERDEGNHSQKVFFNIPDYN